MEKNIEQYVCLHAEYYKTSHYKRMVNHNSRKVPPKYLIDTGYENRSFDFDKSFDELLQDKEQVLKRKNTASKKDENTIVEMVCALNIDETKRILAEKDGYDKLCQGFKLTMEKINEEFGLTPVSYTFHGDEGHEDKETGEKFNNFHSHLVFFNYDFKKERSVLRHLKPKDLSEMQDIAAKCFQSLGMDYYRGVKKVVKNQTHLNRKDFIEVLEAQQARDEELDNAEKEIQNIIVESEKDLKQKEAQLKQKEQQLKQEEQLKETTKETKNKALTKAFNDVKNGFELKTTYGGYGKSYYSCSEENFDKNMKILSDTTRKYSIHSFENDVLAQKKKLQEENTSLKAQNEALKAQIENNKANDKTSDLKAQIEELNKEIKTFKENQNGYSGVIKEMLATFNIVEYKTMFEALNKLTAIKKELDTYKEKEEKQNQQIIQDRLNESKFNQKYSNKTFEEYEQDNSPSFKR